MSNREASVPNAPVRRWTLTPSFLALILTTFGIVTALYTSTVSVEAVPAYNLAITNTTPTPYRWTDPSIWTGGPVGGYPGLNPGDNVSLSVCCYTVKVDATVPNPVTVLPSGSCCTNGIDIVTGGALTLTASSTINSTGTINVNGGSLAFTGSGTIQPQADIQLTQGQLTIGSGVTVSPLTTGGSFTFWGGTLSGPGTLKIPATKTFSFLGANPMTINGGATIDTWGTFDYAGGSSLTIGGSSHVVVNSGGQFKIDSAGADIVTDVSGGSIDVLGGASLNFNPLGIQKIYAKVNNSGTVNASVGELQLLGGGVHASGNTFNAMSTGAKLTFAGAHQFNGSTFSMPMSSPGYEFTGSASTFDFGAAATIKNLKWSGGSITTSNGSTVTFAGTTEFDATTQNLTLSAPGVITDLSPMSATCTYKTGPSTALTLNNQLNVWNLSPYTSSLSVDTSGSSGAGSINGSGALILGSQSTFNPSGTFTLLPQLQMSSTASTGVSGTLILNGGGSMTGGAIWFGGANVTIGAGTFTADDWMLGGGGSGTLKVAGGNLSFSNASSGLNAALQLDSGTVEFLQPSNLTPSNIIWNGGTFYAAPAITNVIITVGTNITTPSPTALAVLDHVTLDNSGTFYFGNTFGMKLQNGAQVKNNGLFKAQADATITGDATTAFVNGESNPGTVQKTGGSGITQFALPFTQTMSSSLVDNIAPTAGTIKFSGGGVIGPGTSLNASSGTNTVDFAGAEVQLNGCSLGGAGLFRVLTGGTVNMTGPVQINAALQNAGTLLHTSPAAIAVGSGVAIQNQSGGLFEMRSDAPLTGGGTFTNAGNIWKSVATGTTSIGPAFTNSGGFVGCGTGTILFSSPYVQSSGVTRPGPGIISAGSGGIVTINGGALEGDGTLIGDVTVNSGGSVAPGHASFIGALTISGSLTLNSGSAVSMKIQGYGAGMFDTLSVTGPASVNATLAVSGPYTPVVGENYILMGYASLTGAFVTPSLPTPACKLFYSATSRLYMTVASTDLAVAQSVPSSVLASQSAVYTITVTNNGPSAASGVSVTDTLSPSVTPTSVTTTAGTCTPSPAITCSIPTIAAGASETITVTIPTTGAGTIATTASVTGSQYDPLNSNNSSSANIVVTPGSDLTVTFTSPTWANAPIGSAVPYGVAVKNLGPDTTVGAYTLDLTLTGGTIVSSTGSLPCTVTSATTATCSGSGLASGNSSAPATLNVTAGSGLQMVLSATVSYAADPIRANNTISFTTALTPSADLAVTQTAAPTVARTVNAAFTITITNNGPSPASGVQLSDSFSTPVMPVSVTTSQGSCVPSTIVDCSIGTLAAGSSATVTITLPTTTSGALSNTASVSGTDFDPNSANNTSTASVTVLPKSDLALRAGAAPLTIAPGATFNFVFTLINNGPDTSGTYTITFTVTGGTLGTVTPASVGSVSIQALGGGVSCTSSAGTYVCTGTGLPSGSSTAFTLSVTPASSGSLSISASVAYAGDVAGGNNAGSSGAIPIAIPGTDVRVSVTAPAIAAFAPYNQYVITVTNDGDITATNVALFSPLPAGIEDPPEGIFGDCSQLPCTLGDMPAKSTRTITRNFRILRGEPSRATFTATIYVDNDTDPTNNSASATTQFFCTVTPPSLVLPPSLTVLSSPVTFSWTTVESASGYELFFVTNGTRASKGKTTATTRTLTVDVPNGPFSAYVVADSLACGLLTSSQVQYNGCNLPERPVASAPANTSGGQSYTVSWQPVPNATSYVIDEAGNPEFQTPVSFTTTETSRSFTQSGAPIARPYYYRVRAINACGSSPDSIAIHVVVSADNSSTSNANVPPFNPQAPPRIIWTIPYDRLGNGLCTVSSFSNIQIGPYGTSYVTFTGCSYGQYMPYSYSSLAPVSTSLLTLTGTIVGDVIPDFGTYTGSVLVTFPEGSGATTHGTTTVAVPISVSLVSPVTPTTKAPTAATSMIVPSVGHLDGVNSKWQSDIRLANVGGTRQQYAVTFIPSTAVAGAAGSGVLSTNISVDAGVTTALDDVVKNWYGVGSLGETANGMLEIKPVGGAQAGTGTSLTTVVSSRTYNVSTQGTLGQFIPAVPFSSFIGKAVSGSAQTILSLQQIQQNSAYRTNLGIVEGAGAAAKVTVSVFDGTGKKLNDFTTDIGAYQQLQLNSFLASQGITNLADGRIEAKVTGGDGKITAYASVVDNATNDPFLVSAVPVGGTQSDRYVLPGVASLNTGTANWQTDMRIFNGGAAPQSATLSLYPLNGGTPLTASTSVAPGEVKLLNGVVQSLFGQNNLGGALHIATSTLSNLVVTGRTYNQTSAGTFGQFVPAVTSGDAASLGGRSLNLLQIEDSPRYRTNLGIAEVSGKPATVQIMVFRADSTVTPKIEIPLAAYEYRQFPVIQSLGLGDTYNARINVQVISGDGRVASYASVIDQVTQDPTYVPAQ